MGYGLISAGSEASFYLCIASNPLCGRSIGAFDCVCFNTHQPKITISIENRSRSFRTKAAVNDRFVTANPEMNFYELLGISESGSFSDIKQAYKQLALKYHPDVSPPERVDEYTKRFIQVQEAYETLSDPNRRALYDRDLARGLHLAFSARKGNRYEEDLEERINWRNQWESQLDGLKRRSMNKDSTGNMSWGARMRRRRNESSTDL
ncbi:chaperone protein dnaJ 20, chloroplastic-like [Macadamia integrifolia]|uniref:chaperone protein dnaJ 20, chloroplastic-like n=1 Tax=Macadamia integrifolia TaxID=60698 RepID=UPI001C4F85A8|nr:chaperone protein dnaJ 20, chloroplastic-like [Macadamia integrifolia]